MIGYVLDWLLGPRCLVCGERVYPKDRYAHHDHQHPEARL